MSDHFSEGHSFHSGTGDAEADYATHSDYMDDVRVDMENRMSHIRQQLGNAYYYIYGEKGKSLESDESFISAIIDFRNINAKTLASLWIEYPELLKPIITAANVAGRAIKRDLKTNIDTYKGIKSEEIAVELAEYTLPHIQRKISLGTLLELDRHAFVDKEIRKKKGQWELLVKHAVQELMGGRARKRYVMKGGTPYEVDVVYPAEGEARLGIDVKRIEALQDTQKRSSEDVDRAQAFKDPANYPNAKFAQVVYFPFDEMRSGLEARHEHDAIDGIYFAGHSKLSVAKAVEEMLADFGLLQKGGRNVASSSE